jgi:hypothetical protein
MKSLVVKHSVNVDGHRTSISLEEAFWTALKEIARERGETLQHLITLASTPHGKLPICHQFCAYLFSSITAIGSTAERPCHSCRTLK